MSDWKFVDTEHAEQFCRVEYFSIRKQQDGVDVEFLITVREYVQPPDPALSFFAQADKPVNQHTAPYTPSGWGTTSVDALWECVKGIRMFPYQPDPPVSKI
jgi:hypothetical protein